MKKSHQLLMGRNILFSLQNYAQETENSEDSRIGTNASCTSAKALSQAKI